MSEELMETNFIIYKTSAAILISGCIYSGMLEKRVIELLRH